MEMQVLTGLELAGNGYAYIQQAMQTNSLEEQLTN
jgi:hypothetical protein